MADVRIINNVIYVDDKPAQHKEGLHIFSGYQMKDTDKNGFADSVGFQPIDAYHFYLVTSDPPLWGFSKYDSEVMSDFVPGESIGAETGGYPAELLTIEQERAEREKESHRQLHGTGKMTITDVMGNTKEVTEGYYLALREHKVLEAHESVYTKNNVEMLEKELDASLNVNVETINGYIDLSTVTFDPMSYETLKTVFENNMPDLSGISISKNAWDIYKGNK